MKMKYLKVDNIVELTDLSKCSGCGMCVNVCPHNVFKIENKKAVIINKEYCMGCGACEKNCIAGIIKTDSGVGCAYAVLKGALTKSEPSCGCSGEKKSASSCCG